MIALVLRYNLMNSSENHFQMVFPAVEKVTEQVGLVKGLAKELSDSQIKILNLIEANSHITKREMAERIRISTTTIDKHIDAFKKKKLLKRVGVRKEGFWKIIDQNE